MSNAQLNFIANDENKDRDVVFMSLKCTKKEGECQPTSGDPLGLTTNPFFSYS